MPRIITILLMAACLFIAGSAAALTAPRPLSPGMMAFAPGDFNKCSTPACEEPLNKKDSAPKLGWDLGLRLKYLHRESAVWDENFIQVAADVGMFKFLNLSAGLEVQEDDFDLHSYFLSYRMKCSDKSSWFVRLNHVEYPDWWVSLNTLSVLNQYQGPHFYGAIGLSYSALLIGEEKLKDPLWFRSEFTELRFVYSLSYERLFINDRVGLKVGTNNINEFQVFGYDQLGVFVEPVVRVTDHLFLRFNYEVRAAGLTVSLPMKGAETWFAGVYWQ